MTNPPLPAAESQSSVDVNEGWRHKRPRLQLRAFRNVGGWRRPPSQTSFYVIKALRTPGGLISTADFVSTLMDENELKHSERREEKARRRATNKHDQTREETAID